MTSSSNGSPAKTRGSGQPSHAVGGVGDHTERPKTVEIDEGVDMADEGCERIITP